MDKERYFDLCYHFLDLIGFTLFLPSAKANKLSSVYSTCSW